MNRFEEYQYDKKIIALLYEINTNRTNNKGVNSEVSGWQGTKTLFQTPTVLVELHIDHQCSITYITTHQFSNLYVMDTRTSGTRSFSVDSFVGEVSYNMYTPHKAFPFWSRRASDVHYKIDFKLPDTEESFFQNQLVMDDVCVHGAMLYKHLHENYKIDTFFRMVKLPQDVDYSEVLSQLESIRDGLQQS